MKYVEYLFKHYENEINYMNSIFPRTFVGYSISPIQNIRNYLIKILLIRECTAKSIDYEIEKINSVEYCNELLNNLTQKA